MLSLRVVLLVTTTAALRLTTLGVDNVGGARVATIALETGISQAAQRAAAPEHVALELHGDVLVTAGLVSEWYVRLRTAQASVEQSSNGTFGAVRWCDEPAMTIPSTRCNCIGPQLACLGPHAALQRCLALNDTAPRLQGAVVSEVPQETVDATLEVSVQLPGGEVARVTVPMIRQAAVAVPIPPGSPFAMRLRVTHVSVDGVIRDWAQYHRRCLWWPSETSGIVGSTVHLTSTLDCEGVGVGWTTVGNRAAAQPDGAASLCTRRREGVIPPPSSSSALEEAQPLGRAFSSEESRVTSECGGSVQLGQCAAWRVPVARSTRPVTVAAHFEIETTEL